MGTNSKWTTPEQIVVKKSYERQDLDGVTHLGTLRVTRRMSAGRTLLCMWDDRGPYVNTLDSLLRQNLMRFTVEIWRQGKKGYL